jgi:hypothetical protein
MDVARGAASRRGDFPWCVLVFLIPRCSYWGSSGWGCPVRLVDGWDGCLSAPSVGDSPQLLSAMAGTERAFVSRKKMMKS